MDTSNKIVTLIKYLPKKEAMLGTVKENLEEDVVAGLSEFSATRWTVREKCFKQIFENYAALQETWKECFQKVGLSIDVKPCIIGCKTFNYFFCYSPWRATFITY